MSDDLEKLYQYKPTVPEILKSSPYESPDSLDGLLKPDLFFDHLFVRTPILDELERNMAVALNNEYRNYQMIFLEGLPRNGKTTFIHHFIRSQKELFETALIDFSQLDSDLEQAGGSISTENPITRELKSHLLDQPDISYPDMPFIEFLSRKRMHLAKTTYFSPNFIPELKRLDADRASEDDINNFFKQANRADTLILFFLYYCWFCYNKRGSESLFLIIFDNLDSVKLNSFTVPFIEVFGQALRRFTLIPQNESIFSRNIYFSRHFKFIFCLREANNALLTSHFVDRLRTLAPAKPFRLGFDSELYQKMVLKRLDFFSEAQAFNGSETKKEILRTSSLLKEFVKEEFFTSYIAPLFNHNFTRLSGLLYDALEDMIWNDQSLGPASCRLSFEELQEGSLREKENAPELANNKAFGAKGAIFFGILRQLHDKDFLTEYPFTEKAPVSSEPTQNGYCLVMRMILSVILNYSNLRMSEQALKKPKPFPDVSIRPILREALKIYPPEDIFEALTKGFLLQDDRLIHLLTFRNKVVDNEDAFKYEIEQIKATGQIPETLKDVYVTLNHAGFIFLKFLLPQFEFYSLLAGHEHALFTIGLTRGGKGKKYLFEQYIEEAQRIVKLHLDLMGTFYEKKIQPIWSEPEDYLRSKFVFKHFGKKGPRDIGDFHATRVIPRHIQYVDRFRRWILEKCQGVNGTDKEELIKVNQKLVGYIEIYLGYMEGYLSALGEWFNRESEATFKWYIKPLKENIETIKKSKYSNFDLRTYPTTWKP